MSISVWPSRVCAEETGRLSERQNRFDDRQTCNKMRKQEQDQPVEATRNSGAVSSVKRAIYCSETIEFGSSGIVTKPARARVCQSPRPHYNMDPLG